MAIPEAVRERLSLVPGDEVEFVELDGSGESPAARRQDGRVDHEDRASADAAGAAPTIPAWPQYG